MKKAMMMMAVVLAAVTGWSANVNWQLTNVRVPTEDALKITTANDKFSTSASGLTMALYLVNADGSLTDLGKSPTLTADGAMSSTTLWTQAQAIAYRDDSAVSADGKNVTLRLSSVYETDAGTYTLDLDQTVNLQNITQAPGTYKFNMLNQTWSFEAVPEPTAIALLLMGVAAVGLKRRA